MGKIADYGQYFLENGGRKLGYDEKTIPEAKDIEVVMAFHIPIWDYNGLTEEEYYEMMLIQRDCCFLTKVDGKIAGLVQANFRHVDESNVMNFLD